MTESSRAAGLDWHEWHQLYTQPDSTLARRLAAVQKQLRTALDRAPAGPITLVSACAGQALDVLGVLPDHPRRDDVRGRLIELEPRNAQAARAGVREHGLDLEVVEADAGHSASYLGAVPADVVLFCGVFGNLSDEDVRRTVATLPSMCRPGASVIWTRHRRAPNLTPALRSWFAEEGFQEVAFVTPPDTWSGVGAHRYEGEPREFEPGRQIFQFNR
jgi:hypothetical protein